jgi:adenylate cyclase
MQALGVDLLTNPNSYHVKCALLLAAGLVAAFLTVELQRQLKHSVRSALERDHAISIFGQHVSPQVADKLLHQKLDLKSEEREACVMFLDIRDRGWTVRASWLNM